MSLRSGGIDVNNGACGVAPPSSSFSLAESAAGDSDGEDDNACAVEPKESLRRPKGCDVKRRRPSSPSSDVVAANGFLRRVQMDLEALEQHSGDLTHNTGPRSFVSGYLALLKSQITCEGRLDAEDEEGNVEYKLRLTKVSRGRLEELVTQMKFRLEEGSGTAVYQVGVNDDGALVGLENTSFLETLCNIYFMAESLQSDARCIHCVVVPPDKKVATLVVEQRCRDGPCGEATAHDVRVALLGPEGAGKSTLVGALSSGVLDNGRGLSRMGVFRHRHEILDGRTSSISCQVVGVEKSGTFALDETPSLLSPLSGEAGKKDKVNSRFLTMIDLGGHDRYIKTALLGVVTQQPDHVTLVVAADLPPATIASSLQWLLRLVNIGLRLPVTLAVTKCDAVDPKACREAVEVVKKTLTRHGLRPILIEEESDLIGRGPQHENTPLPTDQAAVPTFQKRRANSCPLANASTSVKWCDRLKPGVLADGGGIGEHDPSFGHPTFGQQTAVFQLSAVTGQQLNLLRKHLASLSSRPWESQRHYPPTFRIEEVYPSVEGVGLVVGGLLLKGVVHEGDELLCGPVSVFDGWPPVNTVPSTPRAKSSTYSDDNSTAANRGQTPLLSCPLASLSWNDRAQPRQLISHNKSIVCESPTQDNRTATKNGSSENKSSENLAVRDGSPLRNGSISFNKSHFTWRQVKVKSIQVQKVPVRSCVAGLRCAFSLDFLPEDTSALIASACTSRCSKTISSAYLPSSPSNGRSIKHQHLTEQQPHSLSSNFVAPSSLPSAHLFGEFSDPPSRMRTNSRPATDGASGTFNVYLQSSLEAASEAERSAADWSPPRQPHHQPSAIRPGLMICAAPVGPLLKQEHVAVPPQSSLRSPVMYFSAYVLLVSTPRAMPALHRLWRCVAFTHSIRQAVSICEVVNPRGCKLLRSGEWGYLTLRFLYRPECLHEGSLLILWRKDGLLAAGRLASEG